MVLNWGILSGVNFAPQGQYLEKTDISYPNCEKVLLASSGRKLDAAKHWTVHRELITAKNYPAQEVNSAEVGKPASQM